jgi:hypothetical protein
MHSHAKRAFLRLLSIYEKTWAIAIIVTAVVIPPSVLDGGPSICPSRALTEKPCLGCGMTRAFVDAMHGCPHDAYNNNRLVVIVLPVVVVMCVLQCFSLLRSRNPKVKSPSDAIP